MKAEQLPWFAGVARGGFFVGGWRLMFWMFRAKARAMLWLPVPTILAKG